jgi:hypothetical protein
MTADLEPASSLLDVVEMFGVGELARLNVASLGPVGVPDGYAVRFAQPPIASAVAVIAAAFHNVAMIGLLFLDTWNAPDPML